MARDSLKCGISSRKRSSSFSIPNPLNALSAKARARGMGQQCAVASTDGSFFVLLTLQERSANFRHKYIPFLNIVTQKRKTHVLSTDRSQSAFDMKDKRVGRTLYIRT